MPFAFDLVDLQLFVNVSETLSLTRGAYQSHMSVPAARARIKKLEHVLGEKLFHRSPQGLVPTPAGRRVLDLSRHILGHANNMLTEFQRGPDVELTGTIRLFVSAFSVGELVLSPIRKFLLEFPGVNVTLYQGLSTDVVCALKHGVADIGIFSCKLPHDEFISVPYRTERLVLITPLNHPLADESSIDFYETVEHNYVWMKEPYSLRSYLYQMATVGGAPLRVRMEVDDFHSLSDFVEAGLGVSVVPESMVRRFGKLPGMFKVVPLKNDWAKQELTLGINKATFDGKSQALMSAFMNA